MRPDVVFLRGDVKVSCRDQGGIRAILVLEPCAYFIYEIQFVREFVVDLRVGFITACRNVKVVQFKAGQAHGNVAAILFTDTMQNFRFFEGNARENRYTIVAFHAVKMQMAVSCRTDGFNRKMFVRAFGFLKAYEIGFLFTHEAKKQR